MPDDDLESRFTRLEVDVARLREDVASARALAALADRDVAEFRAEMRGQVLNALRETQLEQGQKIDGLRREIDELGRETREGFAVQATGMAQITALLTDIAGPERGQLNDKAASGLPWQRSCSRRQAFSQGPGDPVVRSSPLP